MKLTGTPKKRPASSKKTKLSGKMHRCAGHCGNTMIPVEHVFCPDCQVEYREDPDAFK